MRPEVAMGAELWKNKKDDAPARGKQSQENMSPPLIGIGIDAIETSRVEKLLRRTGDRFSLRVFTPREIAYCDRKKNRAEHYAARFAAKEALMKALGTGKQLGLSWQEIEVVNDALGKPAVCLTGRAKALAEERGITTIHLSLTHLKDLAIAVVILE
ncbi:MAG: holo-ACP synthase [Candidatus Aminicenantales bacterium]